MLLLIELKLDRKFLQQVGDCDRGG